MEEESLNGEKGLVKKHSSNSHKSEVIGNMMNLESTYTNFRIFFTEHEPQTCQEMLFLPGKKGGT